MPYIIALLKDSDIDLQRAAGKFIAETPGTAVTEALAKQLASLTADGKVVLLSALEGRSDKAAARYVAKAVSDSDQGVRLAAVTALGVLGSSDNVALLAKTSADGGDLEKAALTSLGRMSAPGVTDALVGVVQGRASATVRSNAIAVLVDRMDTESLPALLKAAQDDDTTVRQAAYKALGALGGQQELSALVSMLLKADGSRDRSSLERALVAIVLRIETPDATPVVNGLAKADDATKPHLLTVLSRIGNDVALQAVCPELRNTDADIRRATIRALADWPTPAPLDDLLKVARTSDDATEQILALRGYVKLLGVPANRSAATTVSLLAEAMDAAKRPDEKKAVLAALPKYPCAEGAALARKAMQNAALRNEAELAARKIEELLVNQSLTVQASHNGGNAKNAIDGNLDTRWDTAQTMRPGQWFVIDLGAERVVTSLTLDTRNSSNDYPRGYEVYVSFDGGSWGRPLVTGKGTKPVTTIEFDQPVRARFIKIAQTGSSDSYYWSIHELAVGLQ